MPQLANIVINDGQATPVAQTFNPNGRDASGTSRFVNRTTGVPIGYQTLGISLRAPTNAGGRVSPVYRIGYSMDLPVLESASGPNDSGYVPAPAVAYTLRAKGEFLIPTRSTLADRANLRALYVNGLDNALIIAAIENLEDLWS